MAGDVCLFVCLLFFFFNDTATTEIYTLSLHDALPISHHLQETVTGHRTGTGQAFADLKLAALAVLEAFEHCLGSGKPHAAAALLPL